MIWANIVIGQPSLVIVLHMFFGIVRKISRVLSPVVMGLCEAPVMSANSLTYMFEIVKLVVSFTAAALPTIT